MDHDDKSGILLVFLATLMIGLGFGLLYTYKEYKEYIDVIMIVSGISSFLFTTYLALRNGK